MGSRPRRSKYRRCRIRRLSNLTRVAGSPRYWSAGPRRVNGDLNPAPLRKVLAQAANVLCGWWHERWTGGIHVATYVRRR